MRGILFCFFLVAGAFQNQARAYATIEARQFALGTYWEWAYRTVPAPSRLFYISDLPDSEQPHIVERYTVAKVEGARVLIEMKSYPVAEDPKDFEPHHRFWVNLDRCLAELGDLRLHRRFTIHFESRSFDGSWTLVDRRYNSIAFTEKFNCIKDTPINRLFLDLETIALPSGASAASATRIARKRIKAGSFYLDQEGLQGVAYAKDFPGRHQSYRFELIGAWEKAPLPK